MDRVVVGVLLDRFILRRALLGRPSFERVNWYTDLAGQYDLEVLFFDIGGIDLNKGRVKGFMRGDGQGYFPAVKPIPCVIHNRMLTTNPSLNRKLYRLQNMENVCLFNPMINRNKWMVHTVLLRNEEIRPYLPETIPLRKAKDVFSLIEKHHAIYLKPVIGSVGRGIIRIRKLEYKAYKLSFWDGSEKVWSKRELVRFLRTLRRNCLIQQDVRLAKINGSPFDIRVSVQKGQDGKWMVAGMVAKVAALRKKVTNLARGGKAIPLEKVLEQSSFHEKKEELLKEIEKTSLLIAETLNQEYENIADLGLDMGIDRTGYPWFIEVNVRDQRYSFESAKEHASFRRTYENPMAYAAYLCHSMEAKYPKVMQYQPMEAAEETDQVHPMEQMDQERDQEKEHLKDQDKVQ
ncbi:YheC/YheD family protein [Microaerobacter geothermalis]|uniref:YheC/YheD family endospore coat-associated protein n=1 Tax=Microaerobacter geothermalis TaxID=674972 RepID=UPI001F2319A8|nr:YheC/YheD family protein [Microaerobacter geothermalis]MCF6094129.1 YheC/YheD family protein [Microaerobacter geothermalis]